MAHRRVASHIQLRAVRTITTPPQHLTHFHHETHHAAASVIPQFRRLVCLAQPSTRHVAPMSVWARSCAASGCVRAHTGSSGWDNAGSTTSKSTIRAFATEIYSERESVDALAEQRSRADSASQAAAGAPADNRVRVFAAYVATRVDVARLARRAVESWGLPDSAVKLEKDWVIMRVPFHEYTGAHALAHTHSLTHTHVSVSRRGAVVVVNAMQRRAHEKSRMQLEPLLADKFVCPAPLSSELSEDLTVVLEPSAPATGLVTDRRPGSDGRGDLVLPMHDLELDAIRILNSCLAQTVNLQYFELQVDRMYELVQDIFKTLESAGESQNAESWVTTLRGALWSRDARRTMSTKELYRHLGATSSIANAVMLSNLRTSVRPGSTAWNEERYAQMHEALWREFDLEDRYEELERRLNYITDSIKYALEVAKDNKSIMLERLIVWLIAAELAISVMSAGILNPVLSLISDVLGGFTPKA